MMEFLVSVSRTLISLCIVLSTHPTSILEWWLTTERSLHVIPHEDANRPFVARNVSKTLFFFTSLLPVDCRFFFSFFFHLNLRFNDVLVPAFILPTSSLSPSFSPFSFFTPINTVVIIIIYLDRHAIAYNAFEQCKRRQQQLRTLLHEEAELQRRLQQQQLLLTRIAEASVSLLVWWREGAAAAADTRPGSPAVHNADGRSCISARDFPGMRFYSLDELLQLAAPLPLLSESPSPVLNTESETARDVGDHSELLATNTDGGTTPPWLINVTALQRGRPQPVTPALLLRQRLLDPSSSSLAPTHELLLGSIGAAQFPQLMAWLHALAKECKTALQRLRPDHHHHLSVTPVAMPVEDDLSVNSSGLLSQRSSHSRASSAQSMLVMSPPSRAVHTRLSYDDSVQEPPSWDALAWSSLCASLFRLYTLLLEVTARPQSASGDAAAPPTAWEAYWQDYLTRVEHRAETRSLQRELLNLHAALRDICVFYESAMPRSASATPKQACGLKRTRAENLNASPPSQVASESHLTPPSMTMSTPCMSPRTPFAAEVEKQSWHNLLEDTETIITSAEVERVTALSGTVCRQIDRYVLRLIAR